MESHIFFKDAINILYVRNEKNVGIVAADITIDDLVMPKKEGEK